MISSMASHIVDVVSCSQGSKAQQRTRLPAAVFAPLPVSEQQLLNSERIAFTTPYRSTQWVATTHWFAVPSDTRPPTWTRARRIVPVRSDVGTSRVDAAAAAAIEPGLTLLVSHTDARLPSETCEPVLDALVRQIEARAAQLPCSAPALLIEEIWIVDVLSVDSLCHFVDWYLPEPSSTASLQAYGPSWPRPCLPTLSSTQAGSRGRRVIALSIGVSAAAATAELEVSEGLLVVVVAVAEEKVQQIECGTGWRHTLYSSEVGAEEASKLRCTRPNCRNCVSEAMAGASRFVAQQDPRRLGKRLADILLQHSDEQVDARRRTPTLLFQARL